MVDTGTEKYERQQPEPKPEPKPEIISELIEDAGVFDSRGYSMVKVTRNGEAKTVKLPIKSTGVAEFQEVLAGKAPRPPVTKTLIKKGSSEGKELGLTHNQMTIVFDTTDENYVDELNRHNQDFGWKVAVFALNLDWKLTDGNTAETYEQKMKVLKSNGITDHQISKIYEDVQGLTQFAEDRKDFLSENE